MASPLGIDDQGESFGVPLGIVVVFFSEIYGIARLKAIDDRSIYGGLTLSEIYCNRSWTSESKHARANS